MHSILGSVLNWWVGSRCDPTRLAARGAPPLKLGHYQIFLVFVIEPDRNFEDEEEKEGEDEKQIRVYPCSSVVKIKVGLQMSECPGKLRA